jgi:hypothetical protein
MQTRNNYIWSFGWSVALVTLLSTALVILKQLHAPTKAWMAGATGHHWISHSLIVLALFVVIGVGLGKMSETSTDGRFNGLAIAIIVSTIASGLVLAGFFLFE